MGVKTEGGSHHPFVKEVGKDFPKVEEEARNGGGERSDGWSAGEIGYDPVCRLPRLCLPLAWLKAWMWSLTLAETSALGV